MMYLCYLTFPERHALSSILLLIFHKSFSLSFSLSFSEKKNPNQHVMNQIFYLSMLILYARDTKWDSEGSIAIRCTHPNLFFPFLLEKIIHINSSAFFCRNNYTFTYNNIEHFYLSKTLLLTTVNPSPVFQKKRDV